MSSDRAPKYRQEIQQVSLYSRYYILWLSFLLLYFLDQEMFLFVFHGISMPACYMSVQPLDIKQHAFSALSLFGSVHCICHVLHPKSILSPVSILQTDSPHLDPKYHEMSWLILVLTFIDDVRLWRDCRAFC